MSVNTWQLIACSTGIYAIMGILSFKEHLKSQQVQILSDNVTTVAMINGMGGSSVQLDMVARLIHIEAMEANIMLSAKYLPGTLNWRADYLSRVRSRQNLGTTSYRQVRFNHQLKFHCTIPCIWDPQTSGVDALSQTNWGTINYFVNPPFALIPRVLNIIREQKAVATLIASKWVGQPWYQQLMSLLIDQPIRLPILHRTIIALGPRKEPFINSQCNIYAWRIFGQQDCDVVVGSDGPQDRLYIP